MKSKLTYVVLALLALSAALVIAAVPKHAEPTAGKNKLGRGKHLTGASSRGTANLNNRRKTGSGHPGQPMQTPTPTATPTPPLSASPTQSATIGT